VMEFLQVGARLNDGAAVEGGGEVEADGVEDE
jgi:hypothetical protein